MKKVKIFLDDVREPEECSKYMHYRIGSLNPIYLEDWVVVKNFEEFKAVIIANHGSVTHVSFDHDLADDHYEETEVLKMNKTFGNIEEYHKVIDSFKEKTGYHCARWMKGYYQEKGIDLPMVFVHSMNPVGTKNIKDLFR